MPYSRRGSDDERNYQEEAKRLSVVLCGRPAGTIRVFRGGFASFTYFDDYVGPSLSTRMPVGEGPFLDRIVRPWIEGILPDNQLVRVSMARRAGCSPHNPFDLLECYGRDCPGAVQVCAPGDVAAVLAQTGRHEPISRTEIGHRLRESSSQAAPVWASAEEHWSLGGAQGKIALARIDGHWNSCHGAAATTHLLKPGVEGFSLQGLDEYLCMRLATACGLPAASVEYEEFDGVPAIVVERYDREVSADGTVTRLHQEDLCQALGYLPGQKYDAIVAEVLRLLGLDASGQSVYDFVSALFFNYLVGATDAHAKNYSLMHLFAGEVFLAPLYDIASILPYAKRKRGARVAAMPIGREKRFGRMTGANVDRFAQGNGLDARACRERMAELARRVSVCVEDVVEDSWHIRGVEVIGPELARTVRANCEAMLANMDRDGRTCDLGWVPTIDSGSLEREAAS